MQFVILVGFLITVCLGIPIGFAIGITAVGSFLALGNPLVTVFQRMFTGIDIFPLLAIPFFMLAAQIMTAAKITERIVRFSINLVGHITGGLAHVNVLGSMIFAGLTGSAVADAAGLGPIEIKMMEEGGYDREFAAIVTAASAILGPIIPPSIVMIIYAITAGNVTVGELFLAGYIPGILLGLSMMVQCYIISKIRKYPRQEHRAPLRDILISFFQTLPILFLPFIVVGGILFGIFTATEAAAVAVLYAFVVSFFFLKTLKLRDFPPILLDAAKTTSSVLFIVAAATAMSWILTAMRLPQQVAEFFMTYASSPAVFLLFANVLLLITGCLIDLTAALLIMVPILSPTATLMGIDPLHFGLVVTVNLCIGLITPPVGMVLYVTSNVAQISLSRLFKGIVPFALVEIAVLFLITYVPWFTLVLPNLVMGHR